MTICLASKDMKNIGHHWATGLASSCHKKERGGSS